MSDIKSKLYNAARDHEAASADIVQLLREARDYAIDADAAVRDAADAQKEAEDALEALQSNCENLEATIAKLESDLADATAKATALTHVVEDFVNRDPIEIQEHAHEESMRAYETQVAILKELKSEMQRAEFHRRAHDELAKRFTWRRFDTAPAGWLIAWRNLGRKGEDGCFELVDNNPADGNWSSYTHWMALPKAPSMTREVEE